MNLHRPLALGLAVLVLGIPALRSRGLAQDSGPPAALRAGTPIDFELSPGGERRFTIRGSLGGMASIWARSPTLDPSLEILADDGSDPRRDEDGGGGVGAHLWIPISAGARFTVVVRARASADAAPGMMQVAFHEAEESPARREAGLAIHGRLPEIDALEEAGRRLEAIALVEELARAVFEAGGPDAGPALALAAGDLGTRALGTGRFEIARSLIGPCLGFRERVLPEEHDFLNITRSNMAFVLSATGDVAGSLALGRKVLAVRERTLPADHPRILDSLNNVAIDLDLLGRLDEAVAVHERVLAACERGGPELARRRDETRVNLAAALKKLGRFERARELERRVYENLQESLAPTHPKVLELRLNIANTTAATGRLREAAVLFEGLLSDCRGRLPSGSSTVVGVKFGLGNVWRELGRLREAAALERELITDLEAMIPDSHPFLVSARNNHALTIRGLGDLGAAALLLEEVVRQRERALPAESPDLVGARLNLAATLMMAGRSEDAAETSRELVADLERSLPEDHDDLLRARVNLATALALAETKESRGEALEILTGVVRAWTEKAEAPALDLLRARENLAGLRKDLGEREDAAREFREIAALRSAVLPPEHPDLDKTRLQLLGCYRLPDDAKEASALVEELLAAARLRFRVARFAMSEREISEAIESTRTLRAAALGLTPELGRKDLVRGLVETLVTLRGLPGVSASLRRGALLAEGPARAAADAALERADLARRELVDFVRTPATDLDAHRDRLALLVGERDRADRALVEALRAIPGAAPALEAPRLEAIVERLGPEALGVSVWRWSGEILERERSRYTALVVGGGGPPRLVELGDAEAIDALVERWRAASRGAGEGRGIGIDRSDREGSEVALGKALRAALIDPLLVGEAPPRRLVVSLDDALHLVPLDALPDADGGRLGDAVEISVVNGLADLARPAPPAAPGGGLVALGGCDYDERAESVAVSAASTPLRSAREGAAGARYQPLPASLAEVRAIAEEHRERFGEEVRSEVLTGEAAHRDGLIAALPGCRWLHLATHGWFAPEGLRSALDGAPSAGAPSLVGARTRREALGFAPMALCGLALAGANRPFGADGSHRGLITAEELAGMDLSSCELAVLSACETNLGIRRGGQGVMSLQRALWTAGARHSITSLWRVPDEATRRLMARFYEGIWRRGETKREALWNAKVALRRETDPESGRPRHGLRDWAGWVLVGPPE